MQFVSIPTMFKRWLQREVCKHSRNILFIYRLYHLTVYDIEWKVPYSTTVYTKLIQMKHHLLSSISTLLVHVLGHSSHCTSFLDTTKFNVLLRIWRTAVGGRNSRSPLQQFLTGVIFVHEYFNET